MPAEAPRSTPHVAQHLILDAFRILRAQLPPEVATPDVVAGLDQAIELLTPMVGLGITNGPARLYGIAHGLRVTLDDLLPYMAGEPVDGRELSAALRQVEERLLALRDATTA